MSPLEQGNSNQARNHFVNLHQEVQLLRKASVQIHYSAYVYVWAHVSGVKDSVLWWLANVNAEER